jgi:DnaK suppressor protein
MLAQTDLTRLKQKLEQEQAATLAQIERVERAISDNSLDQAEEGLLEPDVAADVYEQEVNLSELDDLKVHLAEVTDALQRMEQGYYGFSKVSGRPIPLERLEVLPWTLYRVEEARTHKN